MPPSHHTDDLPFPPLLQVTDPFHGVPDSAWKSKTMPPPLVDIPSVSDSGHVSQPHLYVPVCQTTEGLSVVCLELGCYVAHAGPELTT